MAISETIPSITHVAVTVTDLDRSEAWYTKVLGVAPVLDEDTGPFRHIVYSVGTTLLGLHGFPELSSSRARSTSGARASTTSPSASRTATSSCEWASASTPWASPMARSRTRATARVSRSATPTTSLSSCSLLRSEHRCRAGRRHGHAAAPAGEASWRSSAAAGQCELDPFGIEWLPRPAELLGRRVQLSARRDWVTARLSHCRPCLRDRRFPRRCPARAAQTARPPRGGARHG